MTTIEHRVNGVLDVLTQRLLRPRVTLAGREIHAFHLCGALGLLLGALLSVGCALHMGLSPAVVITLGLFGVALFLLQAIATKIVKGTEYLVQYRAVVLVLAAWWAMLVFLGEPVLPYLDVLAPGLCVFLAAGRVGCTMVGCCHGRPARCGICYGDMHAHDGFTRRLVGIRLLPVQAIESVALITIAMVGLLVLRSGAEPGSVVAMYIVVYGVVRFVLEFARGDADRRWLGGFSEGQWSSLLLLLLLTALECFGLVPLAYWHLAIATIVTAAAAIVGIARARDGGERFRLRGADHTLEVVDAVQQLVGRAVLPFGGDLDADRSVRPIATSLGYRISGGNIGDEVHPAYYFAISRRESVPARRTMEELAVLVALLCGGQAWELIEGRHGVYHLLVDMAHVQEPVLHRAEA